MAISGRRIEDVLPPVMSEGLNTDKPLRLGSTITLGNGGTVTQGTSATTGVTLNTVFGTITTVTQNIAAAGEVTFTVTDSKVTAYSAVVLNIASGSVATPIACVTAVASGSFDVTITNLHASTAETGTLVLKFAVLNGAVSA